MRPSQYLLVSPGPVDSYPPVQYQARLLADAGYSVTLITMPLRTEDSAPDFSHPGVAVRCIPGRAAFGGRMARMSCFFQALWSARRSLPHNTVEIVYDPVGCFYSDFTPKRPRYRVAHFHELLQRFGSSFLETRLKTAIRKYNLLVVPDYERGVHTQKVLELREPPFVVGNYPLASVTSPRMPAGSRGERFEVVYCGSLGLHQKLDVVIRSIRAWPDTADLVLIGNDQTETAASLKRLAGELGVGERVRFLGWMETRAAEARLTEADLGVALLDANFDQWRTALTASNKRFQYMKAALPQIGDANPGVPQLLEGIGACVGIDHDPEQIGALVATYASNPARCATEGARAFARHKEIYNYEQAFQPLVDMISGW